MFILFFHQKKIFALKFGSAIVQYDFKIPILHKPTASLRQRTLFLIALVFLALTALVFFLFRYYLLNRYTRLEEQNMQRDLVTVQSLLEREMRDLDRVTNDWAPWDDTYYFMMGIKRSTYIEENLNKATLDNLNVDAMMFYDLHHNLYFYKDNFPSGSHKSLSVAVDEELQNKTQWLDQAYQDGRHHAIIGLPQGIALISADRIETSQFSGPPRGLLITVRMLDADLVSSLRALTSLPVELIPQQEFSRSVDAEILEAFGNRPINEWINNTSTDSITGYSILRDMEGHGVALFRLQYTRILTMQAHEDLRIIVALLCLTASAFAFIMVRGLDNLVLNKLRTVITTISRIRSENNLALRIPFSGEDEFGRLGDELNRMFSSLEGSRNALLRNEEILRREALHDPLTHLPNRKFFIQTLMSAIAVVEANPLHTSAVLFIDLDRFKLVNDTYDHLVGDQLLLSIARRLRSSLRSADFLARFGGDEFAVLIDSAGSLKEIVQIAERVQQALSDPYDLMGKRFAISASIGIALITPGSRPEDLLRNADVAMYRAKDAGRATYEIFDKAIHGDSQRLLRIGNDLRLALEEGDLEVYYHPMICLRDGTTMALEALVRWNHAELGLIAPSEFIDVAEEVGLVTQLDEWVLRQVCRQIQQWNHQGTPAPRISINITHRELQDPFYAQHIAEILDQYGISGSALMMEISEQSQFVDYHLPIEILSQLKQMGIEFLIDDFGIGYSSLTYLRRFPANILKIDRSFIKDVGSDPDNAAIVDSIIRMGHNLNMRVLAEGVESPEELSFLEERGCDLVQGFLYCTPQTADQAPAWFSQTGCSNCSPAKIEMA